MAASTEWVGFPTDRVTGISIIDDEHRRLHEFITRLRTICRDFDSKATCHDCISDRVTHCEEELMDCVGTLLSYMVDHFRHEEDLMKRQGLSAVGHALYLQHTEDHANITNRVAMLTHPGDPMATVKAIAETAAILAAWFESHIKHHDIPMLR